MGLQVEHHESFQRREWAAQRIGWVLIALFVVAALAGLLGGPGPLSWSTAHGADGVVAVEYQRSTHLEADDRISVTLDPDAVTGDSVDVELDAGWLEAMDVQSISPQPSEEVETPYGLRMTIPTEPGSGVSIQVNFRAQSMGTVDGGVRFEGQTVPFDQFVYP